MTSEDSANDSTLQALTARIVAAYVRHNALPAAELGTLIGTVRAALRGLGQPSADKPAPAPVLAPAVPIRRSVSTDAIVCLECGKRQKILRRHLAAMHDLTPQAYRVRWGLPDAYPMTAPDYAASRSELAKAAGLGRKGGRRRK